MLLIFCPEYNFNWNSKAVAALGVLFTMGAKYLTEVNYDPLLEKRRSNTNWQKHHTQIFNNIQFVFLFLFLALPKTQDYFFNRLKKIITKFLWYNKPAKFNIQFSSMALS